MATKLEGIAAKARKETNLNFTSLCHHVNRELIWESLCHIPNDSAPGVDGIGVEEAKKDFGLWIEKMLQSIHRKGYKAPPVKRSWIPKPGKTVRRPIGIPCIADRALQRSVSTVLSCIYEQDFVRCSFGGRPHLSAHHALATLNEIISGRKVSWVLEADLKNFFGSLDHGWLLRFVEHRVGDPRIISLIKRWLKAGVLEDGELHPSEKGTPQGGSISVLLSNIYLHYVLDLWFERVVKPRLRGEAYLVRYIDDFVVCFQYRGDACRFQHVLAKRLGRFSLELEPTKTRLVEFGRFALRHAKARGRKLGTIYFLGFTHYCTRNRKGNFMVGRKTEKSRFRRSAQSLCSLMREIRHHCLKDQSEKINQVLRGHYAYYGVGGNIKALFKIYRFTERYWHRMLCSRSRKSYITWERFQILKQVFPLQQPTISVPYARMKSLAVL
ncbi:MAG: group II intron reverse transcriptase/maturase [Proteobacteria bacterium]|nr:group II intron reverse transcriptase/maturase [Pseudomonadota bacterium]